MTDSNQTNGVERREWRDATAAQLAQMDPEGVAKRKAIAERMLRAGGKWDAIRDATREATGTGIGAGTIQRIRREIDRETKRAERAKARQARPRPAADAKTPPEPPAARLPATPEVVNALVTARVPFFFDGRAVLLGGR